MALYVDIMLYFNKLILVYGYNLSMSSPLRIWMPKSFSIANFGHPPKSLAEHVAPVHNKQYCLGDQAKMHVIIVHPYNLTPQRPALVNYQQNDSSQYPSQVYTIDELSLSK